MVGWDILRRGRIRVVFEGSPPKLEQDQEGPNYQSCGSGVGCVHLHSDTLPDHSTEVGMGHGCILSGKQHGELH